MPETPIRELTHRAKQHDQEAWTALYRMHRDAVYGFLWRWTGNQEVAADLCHDTFVRALSGIDRFDETRSFETWLYTIARRRAIDHVRRVKPVRIGDHGLLDDTSDPAEMVSDKDADTWWRRRVWQAVGTLPEAQRAAVLLYYRQQLDVQQVAEAMAVTPSSVKGLLFRARKRLRETISRESPAETEAWMAD